MGARVTILDCNLNRLTYLDDIFGAQIQTLFSNPQNIAKALKDADLVIGAVLIPGDRAPKLIKEEYVKEMKKGAVIVDIAIDQGGACETSHVTTHDDPIFIKHGVVHYCVGNMPGAVPYTSTIALTNVTLKYGLLIADNGVEKASMLDMGFKNGINTYKNKCVNKNVAHALNLELSNVDELF